ncbi:MAG: GHKL domain-containing protein [Bacteroidales bacterium]|nr:GHKL domain-containing protein [Bacteroidales bacterium]
MHIKFEYKISAAYLVLGGLWILFSDRLLHMAVEGTDPTIYQTIKGWFYVVFTALLFFLFVRRHLQVLRQTQDELENHKNNLQRLVKEKTKDLDAVNDELRKTNGELTEKNRIINMQNDKLQEALRELRDKEIQLIQADKMASLGTLTAGVAHEINNPLNYIAGGLEGLKGYFEEHEAEDDKIPLYLDSVSQGVERAGNIVSGLNQFSRVRASYDEQLNIHEIIDNVLMVLGNQVKYNVEVRKHFTKDQVSLVGNVGQMHQVFVNLLINAIQSIDDEGVITISTEKRNDKFCIDIADTGCGISKQDLPRITDPFFTTKPPGEGTGLGLSISYSIIRAHQGEITFRSNVNEGTVATVVLPVN